MVSFLCTIITDDLISYMASLQSNSKPPVGLHNMMEIEGLAAAHNINCLHTLMKLNKLVFTNDSSIADGCIPMLLASVLACHYGDLVSVKRIVEFWGST